MRHPVPAFLTALLVAASARAANPAEAEAHFATRAWPLLKERCLTCHGDDPAKIKGGLDLRDRAGVLRGGDSETAAVIVGKPEESPLYLAVLRTHQAWEAMPPKDNDRLSEVQVAVLKQWILDGAVWPEKARLAELTKRSWVGPAAEGERVRTSGGLSDEWTNRGYDQASLWAYRPLNRVTPPEPAAHPIDAFIDAALKKTKIAPAPRADARSLIRRVTIDLTGLPATPEAVDAFVANATDTVWEKTVRGLLESPGYGEQMARRWMDVVRYADTAGFANDYDRPGAWRYRDYLVRSFNRDTPFDRFIKEQIAGDEFAPGDANALLATGFLRMGPWEHTAMSVAAETRQQWLDDVVNSVGNSFLGLEMSCFRCHDHKFDPLPTRDYYAMQAVFAPAQLAEMKVAFLPEENTARFDELQPAATALAEKLAAAEKAHGEGMESELLSRVRRAQRWARAYEPLALAVYNGPSRTVNVVQLNGFIPPEPGKRTGAPMTVNILRGGSLADPSEEVPPGVLSVVAGLAPGTTSLAKEIPATMHGRRLALAEWIADPNNPLTARVIVNRVWAWHFNGRGLVATPNNFGVKGAKPSHPELLDWLAQWFMDHGWSIKQLQHLIVTSATYRRAAVVRGDAKNAEAATASYARHPLRRLTAEEMRDAMLWASGELNATAGGPPARPQMNWDAALAGITLQSGKDAPYRPALTPAERNRRALYAIHIRGRRDPFLEVFDQPASERSCAARTESTIAPQAFTLLNGDFANDRALAMAQRIYPKGRTTAHRITLAFRTLYGRAPTPAQLAVCNEFVNAAEQHQRATPPVDPPLKQWLDPISMSDPDYTDHYVPDVRPGALDAPTRALADLCLVLLNSAEFLYLP